MFGNLHPTENMNDLKDCRLVVEAVLEAMHVKKKVFATLDRVLSSPDAFVLSNTSTLDISEMSLSLSPSRRPYCAGWHFFSPAHRMKLVEIVLTNETSPETVAAMQKITKKMGKIGVVVRNGHGFVGNRMLAVYTAECVSILAEGLATVEDVDAALGPSYFGFVMGPFVMGDLAGNDIAYYIRKEQGLVRDPDTLQVGPNRGSMRYTELGDDLVTKLGRFGQKVGKGWYDYDPKIGKGRKPLPSKEVADFIKSYVPSNITATPLSKQEIVERVLFPFVNEGFKILEEGIAQRPSDVDVVYLYGYGWPAWRGGPMFWANQDVTLPYLLETLQQLHRTYPGSDYFRPSKLLEACVAMDVTVEEYYKQKQPRAKL